MLTLLHSELPVKIEIFPYRLLEMGREFLLIKRVPEDGGFWQPVTGTLEFNESLNDCGLRELREELGVPTESLNLSEEAYRFSWQKQAYVVVELAYGVQLHSDQTIVLSTEHEDYRWLSDTDALAALEKENNRIALAKLIELLG